LVSDIVSGRKYTIFPLWKEEKDGFLPNITTNSKESVCLITTNTYTPRKKPAVIICPGGGYEMTAADGEGVKIAEKLEEAGYAAFVLIYRVKPNYYPNPQMDLGLAVRYVRYNAQRFGIDPDNIMLMGFSAGGHLVSSYTAYETEIEECLLQELCETAPEFGKRYDKISGKPNKLCLGYSVISFTEIGHEPSFKALTGEDESLRDKLSIEKHVGSDWPKTFLWTCQTDEFVSSENTKRMGEALKEANVDYKMHIYPDGEHGCGLGAGTSAAGWIEELVDFMEP
jgi:acetyl esterase/lipase